MLNGTRILDIQPNTRDFEHLETPHDRWQDDVEDRIVARAEIGSPSTGDKAVDGPA